MEARTLESFRYYILIPWKEEIQKLHRNISWQNLEKKPVDAPLADQIVFTLSSPSVVRIVTKLMVR